MSGISITATRELKHLDNELMELTFSAKSWLASINEASTFRAEAERLTPMRYEYHRKGLGKSRHTVLTFDWNSNQVTDSVSEKQWAIPTPETTLDQLSYQLQLQQDLLKQTPELDYQVADGKRLKHYRFRIIGDELLKTAVGTLATTKVERIQENNKKTTAIWFAKQWQHLIVKIEQREKSGKEYKIELLDANINGTSVTGL